MPNSDAFHLRHACLVMAKDLLNDRLSVQMEANKEEAKPYSTSDLLSEAAQIYKFVCDPNAAETYLKN